jgi:hypothetical protein
MFISRRRFAATCVFLLAACFLLPSRATAAPILCIAEPGSTACPTSPLSKVVSVGDTFDLDIFIENVTDLNGFLVDRISFDPSVLNVQTVTEGTFFSDNCPSGPPCTSWYEGASDNATGTIDFIYGYLDDPSEGVSGSGPLATLSFLAVANGVGLVDFVALGPDGPVILQYSQSNTPVPEPSTLFLVGTGLAFAARRKRSRKIRN